MATRTDHPGHSAYAAFHLIFAPAGHKFCEWRDLTEEQKSGWNEVARAAVEAHAHREANAKGTRRAR